MDTQKTRDKLASVAPSRITKAAFVRAYNTDVATLHGKDCFFDCTWSYQRGYRYNFKGTQPVLYLAADHTVASAEIGPRTLTDLLGPLSAKASPYIYVTVEATASVLDLTNARVRRRLGITLADLLAPTDQWEADMNAGVRSTTQHIGALVAADARFDGMLYPPYPWRKLLRKQGKHNLALFMDGSSPGMAKPRNPAVELSVEDPQGVLKELGLRL